MTCVDRSANTDNSYSAPAGEVLFADVLQLPNGMSKVGSYT
jgi:hypothetical protein